MKTLAERFVAVTEGLDDAAIMRITGRSASWINDIRMGRTKSISLEDGLRICDHEHVPPHRLAGIPAPREDWRVKIDDVMFYVSLFQTEGALVDGRQYRRKLAQMLRDGGAKVEERWDLAEMSRARPGADFRPFQIPTEVLDSISDLIDERLKNLERRLQEQFLQDQRDAQAQVRDLVAELVERPAVPIARRKRAKS